MRTFAGSLRLPPTASDLSESESEWYRTTHECQSKWQLNQSVEEKEGNKFWNLSRQHVDPCPRSCNSYADSRESDSHCPFFVSVGTFNLSSF